MHVSVAATAWAAVLVLVPVAGGHAPARAQDFSITNTVAPADAGRRDVMRQLQAWWDVHAHYPRAASQNDQGGTVKLRLMIRPDGNIWKIDMVESSGSPALDEAGALVFHGGFIRPLPANPAAPDAQIPDAIIDVSLHYVLAHRHDQPMAASDAPAVSKRGFTIANDPVKPIIVDTMLQRTCTGTVVREGLRNHPSYGWTDTATAIFFRKPDGTPWVRFSTSALLIVAPVTEIGSLAQWTTGPEHPPYKGAVNYPRYTVWPEGENRLIGDVVGPQGTVDLTCANDRVPPITSNALYESPPIKRSDDLKP